MRLFLLLLLISCSAIFLSAQSERAVMELFPSEDHGRWQSPVYEIPLETSGPFLSYFLRWAGTDVKLRIRFSEDGQRWTSWQTMQRDEHSPDLPLSVLRSTESQMQFFQIENEAPESEVRQISCHFYNPGTTEVRPVPTAGGSGRSCSDLAPAYIQRSDWCPAGNCAEHASPAFAEVTHLVVHHSAGTNQSNDWPAVVRSIWDYHVNGRSWSDIGYNWLIDPEGNIYTGRSNDAIGAHFCGTNTGTIGICVLGNFTEESPKPEAITALKKLLSWKACENTIDPLVESYHASSAKMLPTIIGHRDGCATACPGNLFYPQLPEIRANLTEDQTTGVQDAGALVDFQLYPNPTPGQFRIVLPEDMPTDLQTQLFDLLGQPVLEPVPVAGRTEVLLETSLPNGTYFLALRSGGQIVGMKKVNVFR